MAKAKSRYGANGARNGGNGGGNNGAAGMNKSNRLASNNAAKAVGRSGGTVAKAATKSGSVTIPTGGGGGFVAPKPR